MTIRHFRFQNRDTGWELEETAFERLNLLVGISGAGKTRILRALYDVHEAALSGARYIGNCSWMLALETPEAEYEWAAQTAVKRLGFPSRTFGASGDKVSSDARFLHEEIRRDGQTVAIRNSENFVFRGRKLPRLDESESVIKLLQSDDYIKPLHMSLRHFLFLDLPAGGTPPSFNIEAAEIIRQDCATLNDLQASDWPIVVKAHILQQNHANVFDEMRQDYFDVFPAILDLRVGRYREFKYKPFLDERLQDNLTFGLREEGVAGWIADEEISAGMMKALIYLIELKLAPAGTVVLIDELENSLGINCLPEVAGWMLKGLDRIQYIATSHHPRVINEIPFRRWRLVTRHGSKVQVLAAADIDALRDAPSLERFTELINLPQYVEGAA